MRVAGAFDEEGCTQTPRFAEGALLEHQPLCRVKFSGFRASGFESANAALRQGYRRSLEPEYRLTATQRPPPDIPESGG